MFRGTFNLKTVCTTSLQFPGRATCFLMYSGTLAFRAGFLAEKALGSQMMYHKWGQSPRREQVVCNGIERRTFIQETGVCVLCGAYCYLAD